MGGLRRESNWRLKPPLFWPVKVVLFDWNGPLVVFHSFPAFLIFFLYRPVAVVVVCLLLRLLLVFVGTESAFFFFIVSSLFSIWNEPPTLLTRVHVHQMGRGRWFREAGRQWSTLRVHRPRKSDSRYGQLCNKILIGLLPFCLLSWWPALISAVF